MKYHCQGSFSLRKCEVERKKITTLEILIKGKTYSVVHMILHNFL